MKIEPSTTRRLALIRLLLARAEEQAKQSPPFSADSVNRLHDVAEMFLALAAERLNVPIPREFMGYWPALEKPLGRSVTYRVQMQKLNRQRVNLKHYGIEPTSDQINEAVAVVRGLISDECPDLLGLELEDVSLMDVVGVDEVRRLLHSADEHWLNQQESETFADLVEAFEKLIRDYRDRKQVWHGRSILKSISDMGFLSPFFRGVTDDKQRRFDEGVIESLEKLDFNLMVVGLGIDLRRYGRFLALTPSLFYTLDGKRHASERRGVVRRQSDYEFCRDFVISTAIHLSEFDYEFDFAADAERAQSEGEEE